MSNVGGSDSTSVAYYVLKLKNNKNTIDIVEASIFFYHLS